VALDDHRIVVAPDALPEIVARRIAQVIGKAFARRGGIWIMDRDAGSGLRHATLR